VYNGCELASDTAPGHIMSEVPCSAINYGQFSRRM